MATIKEVARRARVSVGTVSNVLGNDIPVSAELRQRVERVMRELNYHPSHAARSLKSRRTQTIGVVISDLTNPFFPLVSRGAEDAALKRGYLLNIFNTDDQLDREHRVISILRARRMDGVLAVVSPHSTSAKHLRELMDADIAVVCMDRMPPNLDVDGVVVDNLKGALMCVRHLVAMGHTSIGMIAGPLDLQTSRDRIKGYHAALQEAGVSPDPDLLKIGDFRFEGGYKLGKALCLHHPRPSALFASNGTMGLGMIKALQELGLQCPEDIAVAVFDDIPGADVFRPNITVVSQPAYEIGYRATELLIDRITGKNTLESPIVITLEPELKVRESTVPLLRR